MKKYKIITILLCLAAANVTTAQDKLYSDEFPLGDVTLLDGPLKHARDLNIKVLHQLKQLGRPLVNSEWLHRIRQCDVKDIFPLYFLEKVGCYCWGFVAGLYQTYEPWEGIWQMVENGTLPANYDLTKWQHDLMRPNLRPYDPREIAIIKEYCKLADETSRG